MVPIEHRRQLVFSISLKPLRLRSSKQRKAGRSSEKEGDFIVARISREKQREGESILLASLQKKATPSVWRNIEAQTSRQRLEIYQFGIRAYAYAKSRATVCAEALT